MPPTTTRPGTRTRQCMHRALARIEHLDREEANVIESFGAMIGGYELHRLICDSGNGLVLEAKIPGSDKRYAIKVCPDSALADERRLRKFEREVEIVSSLNLPNIVPVFESGSVNGKLYYVMEFIGGQHLTEYGIFNSLSLRERVALMAKTIRAVSGAHQAGIIHRDLKPSNIIVDQNGEPHILDFGLAKALDETVDASKKISLPWEVVGTLPYISPEQALGLPAKTVLVDVYSLGVVCFELLTGTLPYPTNGDLATACWNIAHSPRTPLADAVVDIPAFPRSAEFNEDLQAIVSKALATDGADRYQSASEFADDLDRYLDGSVVHARSDQRWQVARRFARVYKRHVIAASIVFVVLVGAGAFSAVQWRRAESERNTARQAAILAHDTMENVVTGIDHDLESLAGGSQLRTKLLSSIAQNLSQLAIVVEDLSDFNPVEASLLERQGDVCRSNGQANEARSLYNRALAKVSPDDCLHRARLHRKSQQFNQAIISARKSLELRFEGAELELSLCLLDAAQADYLNGEHKVASLRTDEAIQLLESMPESSQVYCRALGMSADALAELGDWDNSTVLLQRAYDVGRSDLAANPTDVRARHAQMVIAMKLSSAQARSGQLDAAVPIADAAASEARFLATIEPNNPKYHRNLISVLVRLSSVLRRSNELDRALEVIVESISHAEDVLANRGGDQALRRQLGFALQEQVRISLASRNFSGALDIARRVVALRSALSADDPHNFDLRSELALTQEFTAHCLSKLDRISEEFPHRLSAYNTRKDLWRAQPDAPSRLRDLISAELDLATWHIKQNQRDHDDSARTLLQFASDRLQAIAEQIDSPLPFVDRYRAAIKKNTGILDQRDSVMIQGVDHPLPAQSLQARPRLREEAPSDSPL